MLHPNMKPATLQSSFNINNKVLQFRSKSELGPKLAAKQPKKRASVISKKNRSNKYVFVYNNDRREWFVKYAKFKIANIYNL